MVNISVIIPTINEEKYIGITLGALKKQLSKGDEIIIIDSNSTDKTIAIAKKFNAKVLNLPRRGIGPTKTYGAKQAKNKIVAMLDADGIPHENWVKYIKHSFENNDYDAVAGLDIYTGKTIFHKFLYNLFSRIVWVIAKAGYYILQIPWMPVNNIAIKKDILLKYGGWKNVVCEDLDFAKRARGIKVKYNIKMRVTLSDRRFRNEGFIKTIILWGISDLKILFSKKRNLSTDYKVTR